MEISGGLRQLLADVFAVYIKTKNFHWHMSRPHFRDYHLLLDEHASQIFAMTDDIAERALTETLGTINATNLKKARALVESGRTRGKLVLTGF